MKFTSTFILAVAVLVIPGAQSQNSQQFVAIFDDGTSEFNLPFTFVGGKTIFQSLQGSTIARSGSLFNPEDIRIDTNFGNGVAGNAQPCRTTSSNGCPTIDSSTFSKLFTLSGQCVATSVNQPESITTSGPAATTSTNSGNILAHSCFYNLCFGSTEDEPDCINYYAGSPFVFDPIKQSRSDEPDLPPSYPGTIIGGTGKFGGIEGSVEVITVTGTNKNNAGLITQKIFVQSNQVLEQVPLL